MPPCTHSRFSSLVSRHTALIVTIVLAWTLPTRAQTLTDQINGQLNQLPTLIKNRWMRDQGTPGATLENSIRNELDPRQHVPLYASILATGYTPSAVASIQTAVDEARVDKQVGANGSAVGSTSLTSKGSVPAILGLAVENGALAQNVSGSTITFTGRPVQIAQVFQKTSFTNSYKAIQNNGTLDVLNRFSFAFSFDTNRGDAGGTFTGSANQFSGFTLHVDIVNDRDPRDKRFDTQWQGLQSGIAQQLAQQLYRVYDEVLTAPEFQAKFQQWLTGAVAMIASAINANDDMVLANAVNKSFQSFPKASDVPASDAILKGFVGSTTAMLVARQNILAYVGKSPIVTVDYSNNKATLVSPLQLKLPDTSSFSLIAEGSPLTGGDFTFNAVATIFNSRPTGVTNVLRDAQLSCQLDVPLNSKSVASAGNFVLSFSGQYKRVAQTINPMLSGVSTSNPDAALKGNIEIGQIKLTIPVKGSGVKIPVSFTAANRSELINETDIRGNIGITFDMDTIMGLLKK